MTNDLSDWLRNASPDVREANEHLITPDDDWRKKLERKLLDQITGAGLPLPEHDKVEFHPIRRWRFDFAWPDHRIAVEVEGGTRMQTGGGYSGGHAHPDRFEEDCRKYNEAAALGWRLFRFTGAMIHSGEAITSLVKYFTF